MIFRRNLLYPIRLILYPTMIEVMATISGWIVIETVWTIFSIIAIMLTIEAVWEFVHPYVVMNGTVLTINSSILSKRKIDLAKYTEADLKFHDWHVQIGKEFINLRKIRVGHRDRFEEALELYFRPIQA
jgi:hypothetical protein